MCLSKELQELAPGRRRSVGMPIGQRETQTLLDSSPPTVPWLLLFLCANVLHKSTSIPQESFAGCQLSNQPPLFKMYFELCGGVCGLWHVHDSASDEEAEGQTPSLRVVSCLMTERGRCSDHRKAVDREQQSREWRQP